MKNRFSVVGKAMSIDREKRRLTATISTRSKDRDGDIVEPRGGDFADFMRNPVVLWAHDRRSKPIAKVVNIFVSEDAIIAEIEFAKTKEADEIFELYAGGFLNAWSIGFGATKDGVEPLMDEDNRVTGYHFKKWRLDELSGVPVPANAEALTRALKELEDNVAWSFAKMLPQEDPSVMEMIKSLQEKALAHNSKVAEDEPGWGSVDKAKLPRVAYARMGDPEQKSSWGFPHHWVKGGGDLNDMGVYTTGDMYLSKSGLNAAWSAAMGGRSGQRAERAVINHLQTHRTALGLKEQLHVARWSADGVEVSRVKEFVELGENEEPVEVVENARIRKGAFAKSSSEAGAAGKVPVSLEIGEALGIEVEFLVVQEQEGEIVEAKMLGVRVTIPQEKVASDEDRDGSSTTSQEAGHDVVMLSLEAEIANLAARIVTM